MADPAREPLIAVKSELDELTLVRAGRGEHRAWRALVRSYEARVFSLVSRMLVGVRPSAGSFVVETTQARVSALGTCFPVELDPMKNTRAAVGTGLASIAVAIAVYEGNVSVQDKQGTGAQLVEAGERVAFADRTLDQADRARLARGGAFGIPAVLASSQRLKAAQEQALTLSRRIHELELDLAELAEPRPLAENAADETPEQRALRCIARGGPDCSFVSPEQAVLERLAGMCNVWVDHPPFLAPGARSSLRPASSTPPTSRPKKSPR